jgi:purine-binding chemotaxis protein CheW
VLNSEEAMTQYMTFRLGDELFAISVAQVREVLEISSVTRVPSAPPYMRGVVNVRGKAVPVVDLRIRFGLTPAVETVNTRIVVMELLIDGETTVLGGIADSVHEVIELDLANINPPPNIASRWRSDFISGMARRGDDFIIILDVDAVFASDEVALVTQVTEETKSLAEFGSSAAADAESLRGAMPAFTGAIGT